MERAATTAATLPGTGGDVATPEPVAGGSPTPGALRRSRRWTTDHLPEQAEVPSVVRQPPDGGGGESPPSNRPWSRSPCRSRLGTGGGSGGGGPGECGAGAASGSGNSGRPVTTGYSGGSGWVALASQSFNSRVTMVSIGCPPVSRAKLRRTPAQNSSASA